MSYYDWKTTNPDDEWLGPGPGRPLMPPEVIARLALAGERPPTFPKKAS